MNVEAIIKTSRPLPLERKSLIHLMLVYHKVNDALTQAAKPFGISLQQFNVLRILRGHGTKPANMHALNERMVSKMSNTGRLVDKLLDKGLVARQVCPTNRRKVEIRITPQGNALLEQVDPEIEKAEKALTAGFDEQELHDLNNLLNNF